MQRFWPAGLLLGAMCAEPAPEQARQPARPPAGLPECLAAAPQSRVALVRGLREISGLAVTADGRLLAHNDERGEIAEVDPASGRIVKAFALGPGRVLADFEGIAVAGSSIFLVTSDGRLVQVREGRAGETVTYTPHDTGVADLCEVEGLAWEPADRSLLLLCKTPLDKSLRGTLTVFRWSVDQKRLLVPDRISIPLPREFQDRYGRDFRGSALERDPASGDYVALAAINRVAVRFTRNGVLRGTTPLPGRHAQPEALAILRDGRVIIGDEGGKGAGMLTIYACR